MTIRGLGSALLALTLAACSLIPDDAPSPAEPSPTLVPSPVTSAPAPPSATEAPASTTTPAPTGESTETAATDPSSGSSAAPAGDGEPQGDGAVPEPGGGSSLGAGADTSSSTTPRTQNLGTFEQVGLPASRWGGKRRVVWYTLEIEHGLTVDKAQAAQVVSGVLEDRRGWQTTDGVDFRPAALGSRRVDVRVTIASPATTDRLCLPLRTVGRLSCWNGQRAMLNVNRWTSGASTWGRDLAGYRSYLVTHEVGHGIGHSHRPCPKKGRPAPVMHQQTKSLSGCKPNAWPTVA